MKNLYFFKFYVDGLEKMHNEVATNLKQAKVIAKTLSSEMRKDVWVYKNQAYFGVVEYPSFLRNIQLTTYDLSFIH